GRFLWRQSERALQYGRRALRLASRGQRRPKPVKMSPIGRRTRARLFIEDNGLLQVSGPLVSFSQFKVELRARRRVTRDGRFKGAESLIEVRVALYLRDRQIEFVLRGFLKLGGIVKRYRSAIGRSIAIMFLNKLSSPSSPYVPSVPSRWINRWTFLYEVIRDQSMNRVRRSPFRHMTWSAILRVRMAARLHKLSNSSLMAALAGFG